MLGRIGGRSKWVAVVTAALSSALAVPVLAGNANQFGGQDRANAASEMIVLGVQQGISSLPPTSAQAFSYEYSAQLDTYEASTQLGPTALRAAGTIGENRLSVRAAVSYFALGKTLDPIIYKVADPLSYAEFGMSASANVTVLNFAATYGITNWIDVTLDVPVTVVKATASQRQTVYQSDLSIRPRSAIPLGAVQGFTSDTPADARNALNAAMQDPTDPLRLPTYSFRSLGFQFNDGAQVGLSRISVGAKVLLYENDLFAASFAPEFFCNSPSQDQFAGSNSPAILPRAIGQLNAAKYLRLHTDLGYDYDFDVSELRRFVWDAGISVPLTRWTFDLGVGGSKFNTPIVWTPERTTATAVTSTGTQTVSLTALDPNATQLGTNYVDFIGGIKVSVVAGAVVSGAVAVPITSDGFRPAAEGTLAIEYYF